jgi:hypothetical protein
MKVGFNMAELESESAACCFAIFFCVSRASS